MEDLLSKQYFEEVSTQWDQMGESFFGEAPRQRIYAEIDLQQGDRVADIGTGSGYLLEGLLDRGIELVAIDQSPAMLDRINAKFGAKKVHVMEGSSESLPLEENSTDIVMANMYLHHVEHPGLAIREMVRILKKGGTLIFTDLDTHDYDQLVEEQHDRWKGFDRGQISRWMEDAGLTEVQIDCVGADCCTKSCAGDQIAISIFVAKGIKQ